MHELLEKLKHRDPEQAMVYAREFEEATPEDYAVFKEDLYSWKWRTRRMGRAINKIRAEGTAWRLTQDYCLDRPAPVPVEDIAMDRGVLCLEARLTGCLTHLVRKGQRGIIRTHLGIREDGRRRFAIAHELGHWFLHEAENQNLHVHR